MNTKLQLKHCVLEKHTNKNVELFQDAREEQNQGIEKVDCYSMELAIKPPHFPVSLLHISEDRSKHYICDSAT